MGDVNKVYQGFCNLVNEIISSVNDNSGSLDLDNRDAWYADWDNNYFFEILNSNTIRNILRKIADKYYGNQIGDILYNASEMSSTSYPQSYEVFTRCCEVLGMLHPPKVFVTSRMKGINSLSLEVHYNQYILISPQAVVRLADKEQAFLFGHELGHHQQGNLMCHTINGLMNNLNVKAEAFGKLVPDSIDVPFKRWCRLSEFNADRAGYLCCRDIESINSLFLKAMSLSDHSSIDEYKELFYSHPLLSARITELNKYIQQLDQS